MKVKVLAAAICFVLIPVRSSFGITIDPFNTNQSTNSTLPTNIASPAEALGGTRKILAKKTAGPLGKVSTDSFYDPTPGISNGALFHSQDAGIVGESLVTWDGTSSASFNAFGLGGIDFTKDGSSALLLNVLEFNAATSGEVIVKLTVYYGSTSASASLTVTAPGTLTFPFSAFLVSPGVPFDFSKVGALTMNIAGGSAADLTLDFLKTNGKCDLIPLDENQVIVDQCGECGGDDSSCKDCAGIPNGSGTPDVCGVCNGDGSSCLDCEVEDNGDLSTDLDQAAKVQKHDIKVLANTINRQYGNKVKGLKKKIEQFKTEANRLQVRNWTVSWFIPPKTISCENKTLCISNNTNIAIIDEYREHAKELYDINSKLVALYLKLSKKKVAANNFRLKGKSSYESALGLSAQIPKGQDICS